MAWRRLCSVLCAIAVLTVVAPAASATPPACTEAETAEAGGHYVRRTDARVEVWEETNGVDGLQTERCVTDAGDTVDPDRKVAKAPPSPPSLPDPGPICVAPLPGSMICVL